MATTTAPILPAEFAPMLRDACSKLGGIPPRDLAHKVKVPLSVVDGWWGGETLPEPRQFSRLVFVLPTLRYLKPRIIVTAAQQQIATAPAAAMFESPPSRPVVYDSFRAHLRALREASGLTQEDLGDMLGNVTGQTVGQWEIGGRVPVESHYQQLLQLWEELAESPRPPSLTIPPPDGGRGIPRAPVPAPPPSATRPVSSAHLPVAVPPAAAAVADRMVASAIALRASHTPSQPTTEEDPMMQPPTVSPAPPTQRALVEVINAFVALANLPAGAAGRLAVASAIRAAARLGLSIEEVAVLLEQQGGG